MTTPAASIDEYIATFPLNVQAILQRVRAAVREAAPDAQELISYRIPAFRQDGVLVYFGAFKQHIGFYPPVSGDDDLVKAAAPFAGEKGNLRFPFSEPLPLELIQRITRLRVRQNEAKKASALGGKKRPNGAASKARTHAA